MSRTYFSSDWHLGHKNILRWRPQFKSIGEHDNLIIDNHKKILTKRDILIVCGDVAFTKESLNRITEIQCAKKILILGNHCTEGRGDITLEDLMYVFDEIHSMKKGSYQKVGFWITHCPMHPSELRGKPFNIHGHTHSVVIDDPQYINVCLEQTNYEPVWVEDLLKSRGVLK
ncbi:MAG: hypothetical protein ACRDC4_00820 [Plesiomonas sp.]